MKINELLEDKSGIFDFFQNMPALNIGGTTLSAGQLASPLLDMGVSKDQIVNGVSWLAKKSVEPIPGMENYTYGEAVVDGLISADLLAALFTGGMTAAALPQLIATRAGLTTAKNVGRSGLTDLERQTLARGSKYGAAQAAKTQVSLPTVGSSGSAGDSSIPKPAPKKQRYNVGDKIPVKYNGKTFKLPVVSVLPAGYEVTVDGVPGQRPGAKMTVPEPQEA